MFAMSKKSHHLDAFFRMLECVLGHQSQQTVQAWQNPMTTASEVIQPKLLFVQPIIGAFSVYLKNCMLIVPEPCSPNLQLSMRTTNEPAQKVTKIMVFLSACFKRK